MKSGNKSKMVLTAVTLAITITGCTNSTSPDNKFNKERYAYTIDPVSPRIRSDGDSKLKEMKEKYLERLKAVNFEDITDTDEIKGQDFADSLNRIEEEPSNRSLEMAKEYWEAVSNAEDSTGVPKWVLLGIASLEGNGLYTKNPPVPGTSIPTHLYGEEGMNFKTYGEEQILEGFGDRAGGSSDHSRVAGPFKIMDTTWERWKSDGNGDGVKDRYNLFDSALGTAKMLKDNYDFIHNLQPTASLESKWIWAMNAHNAGRGGVLSSVPLDSIEEFLKVDLQGIADSRSTQTLTYSKFMDSGRGWAMREPIIKYWDSKGWKFDGPLRKEIESKTSVALQQPEGISNPLKRWPGDIRGKRTREGYETNRSHTHVGHREDKNGDRISMNMEMLEYSVASYSIGKNMELEMEYKIKEVKNLGSSKPTGMEGVRSVKYHWENGMNGNSLTTREKMEMEGDLGEVGWKGNFPIFLQTSSLNNHGKTPWKFNGRNTTLGRSGCSIYAITSMLHGAGYGNSNIPGTNKKPTLENMAKEFPNGPIIYTQLLTKGYEVQMQSTQTKRDLDRLYDRIKSGIPYVINMRYGEVKGIDENGNKVSTRFTNGGHFVLAVSGYEQKGKRYIELVQSSRSNASTNGPGTDQNKMAFDYDHLIDKGIMRSSGGNAVMAFTVTGVPGQQQDSNYLQPTYVTPKETTKENIQVGTVEKINREEVLKSSYENKNLDFLGTISDEKGYLIVGKEIELQEETLVEYSGTDLYMYLDYINGIKITGLNDTSIAEGLLPKGTKLGKVTQETEMEFMMRDHDKKRWLRVKDIYTMDDD